MRRLRRVGTKRFSTDDADAWHSLSSCFVGIAEGCCTRHSRKASSKGLYGSRIIGAIQFLFPTLNTLLVVIANLQQHPISRYPAFRSHFGIRSMIVAMQTRTSPTDTGWFPQGLTLLHAHGSESFARDANDSLRQTHALPRRHLPC